MTRRACSLLALAVSLCVPAWATDRYEAVVGFGIPDDDGSTYVELLSGQIQSHDLQATTTPDQDWAFVQETMRHSYEVIVNNTAIRFTSAPAAGFVTMNRVTETGTMLTPGAATNVFNGTFAARWISTASMYSYIRVVGLANLGADSGYDLQMRDTTYAIPRWNQSGAQTTVLLIQNTRGVAVTGSVYFYGPSGALLHTQALSIAPFGLQTVGTGAIAALAGQSGSAAIAHLGGYGALAGKAVALEPTTGFTFDTPLAPIPY